MELSKASTCGGCFALLAGASAAQIEVYVQHGAQPGFYGASIDGAGDVNGDGWVDWIVTGDEDPLLSGDANEVYVSSGLDGSRRFTLHRDDFSEQYGGSVCGLGDVDADGCPDLIVGAPEARSAQGTPTGRAWVYSGCDGALLRAFVGTQEFGYFGASVTGLDDIDGDGFGDLAVGAPFEGADGRVHVLSGRDGGSLASLVGTSVEHAFGHDVARAGDMNRDRLGDLLVGAAHVSVEVGCAHAFTSFDRPPPATYCTAKINSAGCTPRMGFAGAPSVWIGARPMTALAHDVVNQTSGLLTWGFVPDATPFAGGLRCVGGSARVVLPSSRGSSVGVDCSGSFAFAFSDAYLAAHGLGPGHELFVQCFYLDPTHPDGTGVGLTDALRFTFGF